MTVCPFFWPLYCLSFLLANVLFVLSFDRCIVCPFFWPLYYLSFLLAIVLFVLSFGRTLLISWWYLAYEKLEDTKEVIRSCELKKTNNTMAKRKDRQYNGQKKGQTIQWPKGWPFIRGVTSLEGTI
jgi:hypothetical protein